MDSPRLIRLRIQSFYNGHQILKILMATALIFGAGALFPQSFAFIWDHWMYLASINAITILWYLILTLYVRQEARRRTSVPDLKALLVTESRHAHFNLLFLGVMMPLSQTQVFNPLWFLSAFFYLLVLGDPIVQAKTAILGILGPLLGYLAHGTFWFFWEGTALDLGGFLLVLAFSLILWFAWTFFQRSNAMNALVESGPDKGVPKTKEFATHFGLTAREEELLPLVFSGLLTKEIAGQLNISYHTAVTHLKNIYQKTGVGSKWELQALFNRYPFVSERPDKSS
jgi:DNA-binding CsgD family transcriptional regulator